MYLGAKTKMKKVPKWLAVSYSIVSIVVFLVIATFIHFYPSPPKSNAWTETCTWTGATGGAWETSTNWDCNSVNRVPTATDRVVIDSNVTVNINATTTIDDLVLGNSGGTTSPILNFNYDAITNGALIVDDSNAVIYLNAQVTHTLGATAETAKVNITVTNGDMTVTGSINVNEKGFRPGYGTGKGNNGNGAGGGAYGGGGGSGASATGGIPYGSAAQPVNYGSGGGTDGTGLNKGAGGAAKITVGGTLTVNGSITATGGISITGTSDVGSGAGGSIWITATTITGAGSITANGGNGGTGGQLAGAGGGGRVALYYTTDSMSGTVSAKSGGTTSGTSVIGAAGTIYREVNGGSKTILIDNVGQNNNDTYSKIETGLTLDTLTVASYGYLWLDVTLTTTTLTLENNTRLTVDAAANCTYTTFNLGTPTTIMDRGGTFALLSGGGALTVATSNTLIADYPRTYTSVTINGTLTTSQNSSAETYKLSHTTSGDYTISSTGVINVSEKGYTPGYGPGKGANGNGAGGAGHGGAGGRGTGATGGATYGSTTQPNTIGSGGGTDGLGLNKGGGGAVKLDVGGTLTINGSITANGGASLTGTSDVGGGSGGSIWLIASTLVGSGTLSANGGNGGPAGQNAGAGSGGRIAIYYTTDTSTLTVTAKSGTTAGGTWVIGAAGTIYKESTGGTKSVTIDNGNLENNDNYATIQSGLNLTTLTVTNKGSLWADNSTTATTVNLTNSGKLAIASTGSISYTNLTWTTSGILIDRGGTFSLLSGGAVLTVPTSTVLFADTARTYTSVTVDGTVTHTANGMAETYKTNHTTSGDYTISATGSIDVTGKGFAGGYGTGKGTNGNGAGGAGYGGEGGNDAYANIAGGTTYGSLTNPLDSGSGGGINDGAQNYGGGVVKLSVGGTLTVNGPIYSNGQANQGGGTDDVGGGSGGSINITASTLAGNSTVAANGTNAYRYGGAGGGGRIAVYYTNNTSSISYQAYGGTQGGSGGNIGAAGTIYQKPDSSNGTVIVNNGNRNAGAKKTASLPASLSIATLDILNYGRLHFTTSITATTINLSANATLVNEATGTTTNTTFNWTGPSILYDRGGTFGTLSGGGALNVPTNTTLYADVARSYSSVTVDGTITHSSNTTAETYKIAYTVTNNVTVAAGGKIDVSSRGYASSEGTGQGVDHASGSGGGGYGGNGGAGLSGAGGSSYGSATAPANIGAGGGADGAGNGGLGGGNVTINAGGTVTITGSILADGGSYIANDSGGGAGGTISINAGTFTGAGTVYARGGAGRPGTGGGGSGGRIAIFYAGWGWTGNTMTDAVATSGGSGYATGSVGTVYLESSNNLPSVSGVAINSGAAAIDLTAGSSLNVSCTGTVSDLDGYLDISSVEAVFYRSGIGAGAADNDNNHYSSTCSGGAGSGTTQPFTCTFPVWFIADPTDVGSNNAADDWTCKITPSDGDGTGSDGTDTIEMNSLSAISVTPSSIDFNGALSAGGNSGSINDTTEFYNIGNVAIDVEVSGSNLCTDYPTCATNVISTGNIEYKDTAFTYGAGIDLTNSPVFNGYNIAKSTVRPSNQSRTTYWGIGIPLSVTSGTYTGVATFTALQH